MANFSGTLQIVKNEPTDDLDVESKIMELCQQFAKGISDQMIQNTLPSTTVSQRVAAINKLLSQGQIELLKSGNQLIYRLKNSESSSKLVGTDVQEKMVYQVIEEAGNKGIWVRDIRIKTNLMMAQVNKVLKSLEGKKLVKNVKSVSAAKKKLYMLFNLEPDRSVTGGAWYSDQDFEHEFVDVLSKQCLRYLEGKAQSSLERHIDPIARRNASFVSSRDIHSFINELGISKVELSVDDIETIVDSLVYDGKVERSATISTDGQMKLYRSVPSLIESSPLMSVPCGVCPVANECCEGGIISPVNCLYLKQWLE